MNEELKKRLIGAAVLTALGVILIPVFFEDSSIQEGSMQEMPIPPKDKDFSSSLINNEVISIKSLEGNKKGQEKDSLINESKRENNKIKEINKSELNSAETKLGLTAWSIKVGSFSKKMNADRVIEKLRNSGFQVPEAELINIKGKDLYRVIVGPMISEEKANNLLKRVDNISGTKGKVVRFK